MTRYVIGAVAVTAVLATIFLGTGAGWAQNFGAGPIERYFRVEWDVGQARGGRPTVNGYLHNDYGLWARDVRILVEALDPSGRSVGATSDYVGEVPPNGRRYFEVPVPARGSTHRVTVESFFWVGGGN